MAQLCAHGKNCVQAIWKSKPYARYKKCDGSKCGKIGCQGCKLEAIHLTVAYSRDCPFCARRMCSEACITACPMKDMGGTLDMSFAGGLSDEQLASALAGVFSMNPIVAADATGMGQPPAGELALAAAAAAADAYAGSPQELAAEDQEVHPEAEGEATAQHGVVPGGVSPPDAVAGPSDAEQAAMHANAVAQLSAGPLRLGGGLSKPSAAPRAHGNQSLNSMMQQAIFRLANIESNQQSMLSRLGNAETTQHLLLQTLGLTLAMQSAAPSGTAGAAAGAATGQPGAAAAAGTSGQTGIAQPTANFSPASHLGLHATPQPPQSTAQATATTMYSPTATSAPMQVAQAPQLDARGEQGTSIAGTSGIAFNLDTTIAQYQQLLSAVMEPGASQPLQAELGAAAAAVALQSTVQLNQLHQLNQLNQQGQKVEAVSSLVDMLARGAPLGSVQQHMPQEPQAPQ